MEIVIGTPTYDRMFCAEYDQSLAATIAEFEAHGISWRKHAMAGCPFVDRARNEIVHFFLNETNADHLLFIDADVGWDAKAVTRFVTHDYDIVAGLVPKRSADEDDIYHQNALTGVMQHGLMQSLEAPTAFMRIRRGAFAKILEVYPEYATIDRTSKHLPFFQTGIRDGGFQGEDIFFCRQWVAMGGHCWIDSDITFTHRGSKAWRGNFYEYAIRSGLLIQDRKPVSAESSSAA